MKKRVGYAQFALIFVVVLLMSSTLVAAGPLDDLIEGTANVIGKLFEVSSPVVDTIFGEPELGRDPVTGRRGRVVDPGVPGPTTEAGYYLIRLVLFILLVAIVWTTVDKMRIFGNSSFIKFIVSVGIGILGTRWLADNVLVEMVLLPYGAMGIAISVFIPLVIIFYFLQFVMAGPELSTMRKTGWIIFALIFFSLWVVRYEELVSYPNGYMIWFYPVAGVLCVAMVFTEQWIMRYFTWMESEKMKAHHNKDLAKKYRREMLEVHKEILGTPHEDKDRIDKLKRDYDALRVEFRKYDDGT